MKTYVKLLPLFLFFLAIYFFSNVGLQNSVDSPQYRLTQSIVDNHSYSLNGDDELVWPDVIYQGNKVYSGRTPGESFLAIPFYYFSKVANKYHPLSLPYNGQHEGIVVESGIEASTIMFNSFLGALSVLMIFIVSRVLFSNFNASYIVAILYGLGTLSWKYSSTFYRHSPHIFFLLISIYFLIKLFRNPNNLLNFILLSISLGFSALIDPTSILFSLTCVTLVLVKILTEKIDVFKAFNHLFIFGLIFLLTNIPTFFYNQTLFKSAFSSAWSKQARNTWLSDRSVAFSKPFIPSFITNFFSPNQPIKLNVFSPYIINNSRVAEEQGLFYASTYKYKGIFFQSPYLFLIFLSFFLMKNKKVWLLIFSLAVISCVMQFPYLVFYSPNSYDTRFFLPATAILSLLVTPFFVYIFSKPVKTNLFLFILVVPIILISFFQSWVSNVENYAPHITGEKRVLVSDLFVSPNLPRLFFETFPNIYNFKIFFIYSLIFVGFGFLSIYLFNRFYQKRKIIFHIHRYFYDS